MKRDGDALTQKMEFYKNKNTILNKSHLTRLKLDL